MLRSHWLAWGLALGLQLCCAGRLLGQAVDVFVSPASQTVNVGDPVSVEIRLNTNGQSVCQGGAFLQFDAQRVSFVSGVNNTDVWNGGFFDVEPAETEPGIISLNVGATPAVSGADTLVSTLNFTATNSGSAALTLLFNPGREETQFFASNCSAKLTTYRSDGSVTIQGLAQTPSVTPTLTPTQTLSPAPTNTATASPTATSPSRPPCIGDCDGNGEVTVDELIIMVNIALETLPLSACPIGDADGSGDITVNEIIEAVGFALTMCPG